MYLCGAWQHAQLCCIDGEIHKQLLHQTDIIPPNDKKSQLICQLRCQKKRF